MKIAISGKSGCGNSTVSKLIAEKLNLKFINYTFRIMAEEKGMDFEKMCILAETDYSYDRSLDQKQKELASEGNCVTGSRLAIWLLEDADIKVFLDAPVKVRAERIHKREEGNFEEVLKKTIDRDKRDTERYKAIYEIDNNKYKEVSDIVIDTTKYIPAAIADIIVKEAIKRIK